MSVIKIAPIVEGDGEVDAFPILIRRVIYALNPSVSSEIARPFRHPSGSVRRPGGIEKAIEAVARKQPHHSILLLIDSDDDCPKHMGAALAQRARNARPDVHTAVILAHREYEAWFLAGAESLAGRRNLRHDLSAPCYPESIRDAKGWLSDRSTGQVRYRPTQDQAALSQLLDLDLARTRSRSLRKLWSEIELLLSPAISSDAEGTMGGSA